MVVEPDSLYGDLSLCYDLIRTSSEDIWDTKNEALLDCCERLEIELEEGSIIVVIDTRGFASKGSQATLQKLVHFILTNTHTAKVICISTARDNGTSDSEIEKGHIEIDTLGFRSTALLFGEAFDYISNSQCTLARSANEFAELVESPFVSHSNDLSVVGSQRRADVFYRMGNGLPSKVISAAQTMSRKDFNELMKIVSKPEINIGSLGDLEIELHRWTAFLGQAVKEQNYQRAVDLHAIINDLEKMRHKYPSMEDLKEQEQAMKIGLADAVSDRQYEVANELKKDLLALKRKIIKERRALLNRLGENPMQMLNDFEFLVDSTAADTTNDSIESSDSPFSKEKIPFDVDCDGRNCTFHIYSGTVFDLNSSTSEESKNKSRGIVCWSNEACELDNSFYGKALVDIDGDKFNKCIEKLPIVKDTPYGPVLCVTGMSLLLGDVSECLPTQVSLLESTRSPGFSWNSEEVVILTVGPFLCSSGKIDTMLERDNDFLRFSKLTTRSCYRSSVTRANEAELQVLAISPLTTRTKSGRIYEEMLRIGLQTLTEEAKFSKLDEVHIIGKDPQEAAKLVDLMQTIGYNISQND